MVEVSMDVEAFNDSRTAVGNLVGVVDGQDTGIIQLEVLKSIGRKAEWKELPLICSDQPEKVTEELLVRPCTWTGAPWQAIVREIAADEQWLEVSNGVIVGVHKHRKYLQVSCSDEVNIEIERHWE